MKLTRRVAALGVGALVATTPALAMAASGSSTSPAVSPELTVRRIDASAFPTVRVDVQWAGSGAAPSTFRVQENGRNVTSVQTQTLAQSNVAAATVFVVDTASSMLDQGKLDQVKAALRQYVAQREPNEQIALVSAGPVAQVTSNLTGDGTLLDHAIDGLAPNGELALYDGVRAASQILTDRADALSTIVVIADRGDTLSKATRLQAVAAAAGVRASTWAIGLSGGSDFDPGALRSFVGQGGQYLGADASTVGSAVTAMRRVVHGQTRLSYTSSSPQGALALTVAGGGLTTTAQGVSGSVAIGADTATTAVKSHKAPGPFSSTAGLAVIAVLALVAAGLLAYGLLALGEREDALGAALHPYQERGDEPSEEVHDGSLVQTALVARAVATTARIAEERGILDQVDVLLEQADLSLRPAELLFFYGVSVIIVFIAALFAAGPLIAFLVLLLVALAPPAILKYLAKQRVQKFTGQLPDALQLLSSSLRAGFSFLQGVEAVSQEAENPMGKELRRVIVETRLGRPVEDALQDCADRMRSVDFDWAVMAVRIQREVGGNLAELLQTVAETMIERDRLRRDVRSLTAEGRISAYVLGALPVFLGLAFELLNPKYMKVLFTHIGGEIALAVTTVVAIIGFVWMNRIVNIEI